MTDERTGMPKTTGPVGRAVRLLLAAGFAYGFATLVDQGGPASIRDPETLTEVPFVVGEVRSGAVWGSPLSDVVWTLDVTMLFQTIVALLIAVVLGTPGCEIGVWAEIAARLRGRSASPAICIIGLHHLDEWEARRRT